MNQHVRGGRAPRLWGVALIGDRYLLDDARRRAAAERFWVLAVSGKQAVYFAASRSWVRDIFRADSRLGIVQQQTLEGWLFWDRQDRETGIPELRCGDSLGPVIRAAGDAYWASRARAEDAAPITTTGVRSLK